MTPALPGPYWKLTPTAFTLYGVVPSVLYIMYDVVDGCVVVADCASNRPVLTPTLITPIVPTTEFCPVELTFEISMGNE